MDVTVTNSGGIVTLLKANANAFFPHNSKHMLYVQLEKWFRRPLYACGEFMPTHKHVLLQSHFLASDRLLASLLLF